MKEVYSPETLAERWECSARHVRDMCNEGTLKHFRVGRMFRIRWEAIEEYERGNRSMSPPPAPQPLTDDQPKPRKRLLRLDVGKKR